FNTNKRSSVTLSTCPTWHGPSAPQLLAAKHVQVDTLFTYHRTWETGVGNGHEGRRIQPFIFFPASLLRAGQCSTILTEESMKKAFCFLAVALIASSVAFAETAAQRVQSAATVLDEIMATPDKGIPVEILDSAKCIAVVPSLLKGGFIVGGAHGKGMATCRTANGWSAPAPFTMTGGSVGFQIGGQAVDLIMMIMNDRGMQALLSSK